MKKILFINPVNKINVMKKSRALALPPYSFLVLASLTPNDVEVQILDEAYEEVDYDIQTDLVAVTCLTYTANRAYEITSKFRERGVKTVIGGVHPSMRPDESAQYADTIVIGEADDIWPQLVRDFQKGSLKTRYQADKKPDISRIPPANRELLKGSYFIDTIQTARGCPNTCKFCAVHRYNGASYRYRDLDLVISEIEQMKKTNIMIIDDNIVGRGQHSYKRARELFDRMKPLKKKWAAQTCINIADEPDLLKAAGDSGASIFLIGFESINQKSIEGFNKNVNLKPEGMINNYEDSIKKIHDQGIAIIGSYIFGMDTDSPDTFKRTVEFVMKNKIDAVQFCIATPYPGT
ncbi:MAG TPA: radical SAM protein, partial [Syntrophorhabdaceae bacterium]|nr:radical SAM protein [Syntrophorhabdaceae bacterium]